jgi:hypothetical protein
MLGVLEEQVRARNSCLVCLTDIVELFSAALGLVPGLNKLDLNIYRYSCEENLPV